MQEIKRHGDSALTFFPRQPPIVLLQPTLERLFELGQFLGSLILFWSAAVS